jgi:hypothetical protein
MTWLEVEMCLAATGERLNALQEDQDAGNRVLLAPEITVE